MHYRGLYQLATVTIFSLLMATTTNSSAQDYFGSDAAASAPSTPAQQSYQQEVHDLSKKIGMR